MAELPEFSDMVREDLWTILSRKYSTVRQGGHPTDTGEHRRERSFWPDMSFHEVRPVDLPDGVRQIRITFTPRSEPKVTYGYKVNVETAAAAWSLRVGIREPRKNPSMFAAELIWYMIAYIGSTKIEDCPEGEGGVRWINTGDDLFQALPDPDTGYSH